MQYSRTMMRTVMALALVTTLAGCDDKKDATVVAPTPMPTTAVAPTPSGAAAAPSGAAAAPSGAAVAPSGAAVAPSGAAVVPTASGTSASGEAAKPETHPGDKNAKATAPKKPLPPPGAMPHGNPEDGTLRYNPPPGQNPPAKKDTAH